MEKNRIRSVLLWVVLHSSVIKVILSHTQFRQVVGQVLLRNNHTILDGHTHSIETCTLLCAKNENCTSFAFYEDIQYFELSSAPPVMLSEDEQESVIFMKVRREFLLEPQYTSIEKPLNNSNIQALEGSMDLGSCIYHCNSDLACYGFGYGGLTGLCCLLRQHNTDNHESTARRLHDVIYYKKIPNIAQDKPAIASSYLNAFMNESGASVGNNGNYSDHISTAKEVYPYWRVDLERMCTVLAVRVYNHHPSILQVKMSYPVVYVGETANITYKSEPLNTRPSHLIHPVCGYKTEKLTDIIIDFECDQPLIGQYVFIDVHREGLTSYLHFAELEVYGHC